MLFKNKTKYNKVKYFQSGGNIRGQDFYGSVEYTPTAPNVLPADLYKYSPPQESPFKMPNSPELKDFGGLEGHQKKLYDKYLKTQEALANGIRNNGTSYVNTIEGKNILHEINILPEMINKLKEEKKQYDLNREQIIKNDTANQPAISPNGEIYLFNPQSKKVNKVPLGTNISDLVNNKGFKILETSGDVLEFENRLHNGIDSNDFLHSNELAQAYPQHKLREDRYKEINSIKGHVKNITGDDAVNLDNVGGILGIRGIEHSDSNNVLALSSFLDLGLISPINSKLLNSKEIENKVNNDKLQLVNSNPQLEEELSNIKNPQEKEDKLNTYYYATKLINSNYWKGLGNNKQSAYLGLAKNNLGYNKPITDYYAEIANMLAKEMDVHLNIDKTNKSSFKASKVDDIGGAGLEKTVSPTEPVSTIGAMIHNMQNFSNDGTLVEGLGPSNIYISNGKNVQYLNSLESSFPELQNNIKEEKVGKGEIIQKFDKTFGTHTNLNSWVESSDKVYTLGLNSIPKELVKSSYPNTTEKLTITNEQFIKDGNKIIPARSAFYDPNYNANSDPAISLKTKLAKPGLDDITRDLLEKQENILYNAFLTAKKTEEKRIMIYPLIKKLKKSEAEKIMKENDDFFMKELKPNIDEYLINLMNNTEGKEINGQFIPHQLNEDEAYYEYRAIFPVHPNTRLNDANTIFGGKSSGSYAYPSNVHTNIPYSKKTGYELPISRPISTKYQQGGVIFKEDNPIVPKFVFKPITIDDID